MKNISIIVQKLNGGGAERCAANLSLELSKYYNVKLIVFDNSNQVYRHGGELIDLGLPPRSGVHGKIVNVIKRIICLKKIKKSMNIECSISLLAGANLVNVLSRYKDKVIISERNLTSFFETSFISKLQVKLLANSADKVVALSNKVKKDLIENFNISESKIITIYNSCDYNRLKNPSKRAQEILQSLNSNYKYITTVGRLTEQKSQCNLIKSFKLINDKIPESRLLILGEGELEGDLKNLAKSLNLDKYIIFPGYVKDPHAIIEKCDIFAFTSIVEGLGNVLLEALACSKVIVSSDCDAGPREILAPNTDIDIKTDKIEFGEYGVLVPTFTKEESNFDKDDFNKKHQIIADAIIDLLLDDSKKNYYENQAKKRIEDFTPINISNCWKKVIEE